MRVFSGIQPSGNLHLGNYLGAIVNFVKLQNNAECIYCVVDLHSITVWQDPSKLQKNINEITAGFIASGLDPEKSIIFNQSKVKEHAELSWLLNCVARVGWLNRMTQFKEKAGKNKENMSVGLYTYPILMAADILAYKATHVPVGEDQKQHIELSRDIAQKFNIDFKDRIQLLTDKDDFFVLPEPLISGPVPRVMSLRDGLKKMSSSEISDMTRINILDEADLIANKIKKAKTDSDSIPDNYELINDRPELKNLLSIYAGVLGESPTKIIEDFSGKQFSHLKTSLTELLVEKICPIGNEMKKIMNDKSYIDNILNNGALRAREISEPVLVETKKIIGLG